MKLQQSIDVPFRYTIHFTRDVFDPDNRILCEALTGTHPKVAVFVDSGLAQVRPRIREEIGEWIRARRGRLQVFPPLLVTGGEACKNGVEHYLEVVRILCEHRLDRHCYVVIVGGGAVQDAVGFAAATVHRGIRHIRVPTTVLAQNDSGVGVKNGVNFAGRKNFLGTFTPPWAVVNDLHFLRTLSLRDWVAGISEAFKVALIKDRPFLSFLIARAGALRQRDENAMQHLIVRCATLHAAHIQDSSDPFETRSARPLDFGHWSAHHLEMLSDHELRHGEAVAIGIALDLTIARNRQLISPREHQTVLDAMRTTGLPLWHAALECRDRTGVLTIYHGLEDFRQHLGGALTLAMPHGLGRCGQVTDLAYDEIERAVEELINLREPIDDETGKGQPSHVLPQHSSR
jgi:3-dehydroquinate synthase